MKSLLQTFNMFLFFLVFLLLTINRQMFAGLPSLLASSLSFCRCSKYRIKLLRKLIDKRSKSFNIYGFPFLKCTKAFFWNTIYCYSLSASAPTRAVGFKKHCFEPRPGKNNKRSSWNKVNWKVLVITSNL